MMIIASTDTCISFYLRYNTARVYVNALRGIGQPSIIRFLINTDRRELIMQPWHQKEFQSFRVPRGVYQPKNGIYQSMELHSKPFCQLLALRLAWNPELSYRIPGKIYPAQKLVVFDLGSSTPIL